MFYSFVSKERKTTTNKCIVFDFDELQCHSVEYEKDDNCNDPLNYIKIATDKNTCELRERLYQLHLPSFEDEKMYLMWGVVRPKFYDFLKFCFKHFKVVAVWSAGEHDYVHDAIHSVWKNISSPHVCFTRNECVNMCNSCGKESDEDECESCGGEVRMVKPLRKFWEHPVWGKYMKPENTVIVDDRNSVFTKCNPRNGIQLPMFEPELTIEGINEHDDTFDRLRTFFESEKFIEANDVRKIDMQIFTEDEVREDD